jgi:5,10-methylenetetrahydromethanopterin reductase
MSREISIAFQTDKTPAHYIALAKLVNQYDFDAVSVYCDAPFQPSYGPLLLMAPHITRARLGPAAISPSRIHPLDIAAETALLSQLAQGGVYIGIARGAWLAEHGINEITPPLQAIREAIEVVRYMLAGKTGGYQGQIYQIAEHVVAPYPLPEQEIPILIGTWGKKLCALAGEIADEVKVGGSTNPTLVPLDPTLQIEPELIERLRRHVNQQEMEAAARLISDNLLNRFAFAGDSTDLIQQGAELFEAGVHRIEFGTPHGLEKSEVGIQLLGEKVIPALSHWLD